MKGNIVVAGILKGILEEYLLQDGDGFALMRLEEEIILMFPGLVRLI